MKVLFLTVLAAIAFSGNARAFSGAATQMQMAPQILPMGTCTQLSSSWTPQWASLKQYWKLDGADSVPIANGTTVVATIGKVASMQNANGTGGMHAYGVMGNGIAMDGVDDNVVVAYGTSLEHTLITISAWIKLNALPAVDAAVVSKLQSSGYGILLKADASVQFLVWVNGAYRTATSPAATIDIGIWHHLVGTYDGANAMLYMDGVAVATTPYAGTIAYPVNNAFCIGADTGNSNSACTGGRRINGTMDDVAIWNVGLTAGEVATLYNRTGCAD